MILIVYCQCTDIQLISVLFDVTILKNLLILVIIFVDALEFSLQTIVLNTVACALLCVSVDVD